MKWFIALLVVLVLVGFSVAFIRIARSSGNTGIPASTTKAGAEYAVLWHPPAFAIDEVTLLTKNNTSAYCNPGGGNFECTIVFNGQTANAFVDTNGVVTYH
jgi:hypothetical protein